MLNHPHCLENLSNVPKSYYMNDSDLITMCSYYHTIPLCCFLIKLQRSPENNSINKIHEQFMTCMLHFYINYYFAVVSRYYLYRNNLK